MLNKERIKKKEEGKRKTEESGQEAQLRGRVSRQFVRFVCVGTMNIRTNPPLSFFLCALSPPTHSINQ